MGKHTIRVKLATFNAENTAIFGLSIAAKTLEYIRESLPGLAVRLWLFDSYKDLINLLRSLVPTSLAVVPARAVTRLVVITSEAFIRHLTK
jgi:hypothetical protein